MSSEIQVNKPAHELTTAEKTDLLRQFDFLIKSGSLPKHINTPHRLFMAYKLLTPLGLDWAVNLKNVWMNPSTQAFELCNDAPLAACQRRRNEYVGTVEYHVNAKGEKRTQHNFIGFKVEGAVCIAKRRDKEDCVGLFTMDQARTAGLLGKDNWKKYPEAMLTKRARAIALRLQWSDVLQGVGIYEADEFVAPKASSGGTALVEAMIGKTRRLEGPASTPQPNQVHEAEPEPEPAQAQPPAEPDPQPEDSDDLDAIFGGDEAREPGLDG